jgi:glycosyltransferase involved in cell wall biosynthesis
VNKTVDVVIIGLNSARTIAACIESVQTCAYPQGLVSVFYADGCSNDDSRQIAESLGAKVILVETRYPSPGSQRNAGWKAGSGELVQFLDSDTVMDSGWLAKAVTSLGDGYGAACGDRREMHPEASVFNWIGDREWNGQPGDAETFGGDVLVRRAVLESTGGYDPDLIAGEDPELSHRIRLAGFRILKLPDLMTRHDLAMHTLKQYWRRNFRTGHGFAEVNARHPDFWRTEVKRIFSRAGLFLGGLLAIPFALFFPLILVLPLFGSLILLRPRLLLVGKFSTDLAINIREAKTYAWHASLSVVPQFFGMLRFHWGRISGKRLTNRRR